MLSALRVTAVLKEKDKASQTFEWDYTPLQLLSYLQQAWPGVESAVGQGLKTNPYQPKTPKQWFYCAKDKGGSRFPNLTSGMAWFKVGGRFITVDPSSLYSSDYGIDGSSQKLANPTYPVLREAVSEWKKKSPSNTDALLAQLFRKVISGQFYFGAPPELPVLANVLLLSEVARNHTAFHTNLMAVDLIQFGAKLPLGGGRTLDWTWENAIWIDDACPTCGATGSVGCGNCGGHGGWHVNCVTCGGSGIFKAAVPCFCKGKNRSCARCGGTGHFKPPLYCKNCGGHGSYGVQCSPCKGHGNVKCKRCNGKGTGTVFDEFEPRGASKGSTVLTGGEGALQNGLLPMSHMGSAFGSAFDLSGGGQYRTLKGGTDKLDKTVSALTVVRRKEATLLIQWLHHCLEGSVIQFAPDQTLELSTTLRTANDNLGAIDFAAAYAEVTSTAQAGLTLDDDRNRGDVVQEIKDTVRAKMLRYMALRAENFWFALGRGDED